MDCGKSHRLLHLNKEGELSTRERRRLAEHAQSCKSCALELQRIEQADKYIQRIILARPEVPRPKEFVDSVMEKVRQASITGNQSWSSHLLQTILDFMVTPRARMATAALTVVALGTFAYQEISLLSGIRALEIKMAAAAGDRTAPTVLYSISSEEIRKDPVLRQWNDRYRGEGGFAGGDFVVMSRHSLNTLIAQIEGTPANLIHLQEHFGIHSNNLVSLLERLQQHATIRVHITMKGS